MWGRVKAKAQLGVVVCLLLIVACGGGSEKSRDENYIDLPEPSGPPVAQQVGAPSSNGEDPAAGPNWEIAARGERTTARLVNGKGTLLLSISCAGAPMKLVTAAPSFSPIGNEDRFNLGLGNEPVTLVADPSEQRQPGVTAEGAVPANFGSLLKEAQQVSAVYGRQQVGPYPAPPEELKEALGKSCSG